MFCVFVRWIFVYLKMCIAMHFDSHLTVLQEKERLKQEKKDKIRLNKEKKLELRRMEMEKAKELRQPKEDMCLTDHKVLTH